MSALLRKRRREDVEADDYSGGIESEINQSSSSNKKHTMESDDEEDLETYNKKKYGVGEGKVEGEEDLEEGAEEFHGETLLTPFNMKDELEEGYFDARGMYIRNKKDESEIKDSWLDSVDWVKIRKAPPPKEGETKEENESEEKVDVISWYKECLSFLTPGESFLKAIKRLGGGKQLTASERLKQKKLAKKQMESGGAAAMPQENPEKPSMDSVNKLTELINKIMFATGNMDIYDETFESVTFKIQEDEKSKATCEDDIFQ